jgi:hypothetical protein
MDDEQHQPYAREPSEQVDNEDYHQMEDEFSIEGTLVVEMNS